MSMFPPVWTEVDEKRAYKHVRAMTNLLDVKKGKWTEQILYVEFRATMEAERVRMLALFGMMPDATDEDVKEVGRENARRTLAQMEKKT